MLKEKLTKTKEFVKEHKTEIFVSVVSIGTIIFVGSKLKSLETKGNYKIAMRAIDAEEGVDRIVKRVNIMSKKNLDETIRLDRICGIAFKSLNREESDALFERAELVSFIENLDHSKTINVFHRIPEKEKRIHELDEFLEEIRFDKNLIKEMMEPIWGDMEP